MRPLLAGKQAWALDRQARQDAHVLLWEAGPGDLKCAAEADPECGCPSCINHGHINSLEVQKLLQRDRCLAYHAELAVLLGVQKDFQIRM